jgi:hypothetical protein
MAPAASLLAELTREHQILLEHHRRDPDCTDTWQLLERARFALNAAWLRHTVHGPR